MELGERSLLDVIEERSELLPWFVVAHYFRQLLLGLSVAKNISNLLNCDVKAAVCGLFRIVAEPRLYDSPRHSERHVL